LPTYVYRCKQCGSVIERRQRFSDEPLTECESCQGQLQKVLQPVGIIFKGSGFYSTDSRGGSSSAINGGGEKSEGGSSSEEGKESEGRKASEGRKESEGKDSASSKDSAVKPAESKAGATKDSSPSTSPSSS